MKDKARESMHRRAQKAEAALGRASFWIRCIRDRAKRDGDGYTRAVAEEALKEMQKHGPTCTCGETHEWNCPYGEA